jgi:hypothetical protein
MSRDSLFQCASHPWDAAAARLTEEVFGGELAIYFLLSEKASRTTGQDLFVAGGLHEAFLR